MKIHSRKYLIEIRRKLRKSNTPAEDEFWKHIRNGRLFGLKFKRQHSIGNYVVDFYCASHRLIIELDGGIHNLKEQKEKDIERDENLIEMEFTVLRFKNEEIFESLSQVKEKILNTIN